MNSKVEGIEKGVETSLNVAFYKPCKSSFIHKNKIKLKKMKEYPKIEFKLKHRSLTVYEIANQ